MISKGFSIHFGGREKRFPKGSSVPKTTVEEFNLVSKGLVESDPGETGGPSSGSRKAKPKTAK